MCNNTSVCLFELSVIVFNIIQVVMSVTNEADVALKSLQNKVHMRNVQCDTELLPKLDSEVKYDGFINQCMHANYKCSNFFNI